jgi:glycosyltransferase involved in cell wall biosynthesis
VGGGVTISVCLATYNGQRYLDEQLRSILDQLGPDDEVIISDDASTDDTLSVARAARDRRVRILDHTDRVGYSKNFERAVSAATGEIIFLSDQDDVWLPGKVERMVAELDQHDLVVSDVSVVDGDLRVLDPSHFAKHRVRRGFVRNLAATRYIGAAMAMRRELVQLALPFPDRVRWCAHDYWLTLVGEAYGRVALVDDPLMLYRRHEGVTSTGGERSANSLAHKLLVRGYCLLHLAARAPRGVAYRRPRPRP